MGLDLLAVSSGIIIALVVGLNASRLGHALGLLDYPDAMGGRKRHQAVTPLVGGIAVFLSFEAAVILLRLFFQQDSAMFEWQIGWIAIAVGVMSMIGLADDRFGLSATFRLVVATAALLITIIYVPDFRVEFLRFNGVDNLIILPEWLAVGFTLICLIGLLNAVNMADGKNGLVITLAIIWTAVLFARNPHTFDPLLFAVASSLVVLLYFNMRSALFLGDCGSYGISAIFGLLAIYAYNHSFATFAAEQVAIMFLVPVLDTVRLMTWRLRHGRSPFAGDRNHLHHYLHGRLGWPAGLLVYAALVAIPNVLSILAPAQSLTWLGLGFLLYGLTLTFTTRRGTFRQGFTA